MPAITRRGLFLALVSPGTQDTDHGGEKDNRLACVDGQNPFRKVHRASASRLGMEFEYRDDESGLGHAHADDPFNKIRLGFGELGFGFGFDAFGACFDLRFG